MDAFEQLISEILWMDGHWVRTSVKVRLEKVDKRRIRRPSCPRWELDIVAYRGGGNELTVVECKSYLDSRGVHRRAFDGTDGKSARRYKLFTDSTLRQVVLNRLRRQFVTSNTCAPNVRVKLCLACGRIASDSDRQWLHTHFRRKGWELWDEQWLRRKLQAMSDGAYENHVPAVVSKLLLRDQVV